MNLKEIRARLAEIKPDIETLGSAEVALSAEDETRLSDLITEWDTLEAEKAPLEKREADIARIRAAAVVPGATEDGDGAKGGVQVMRQVVPFADGDNPAFMRPGEARDKALKALDSDDLNGHLDERQKVHMEKLLRTSSRNFSGTEIAKRMLATEDASYRSAFMKLAVQPNAVLTQDEGRAIERYNEMRAMNITTDASGGFGVPVLIDPTIQLTAQGSSNPILSVARVETITNDEWKGVSSDGVTWAFGAESAVAADGSPTLAGPSVKAHKAQGFIPFTIEVGMDYPGFALEMGTLLSEGYSEKVAEKFAVGTGTNEPFGIQVALTGTASEVDAGGTAAFAAADVNLLWAALPERYRANAVWLSNTGINELVQQMGNGADASFTVDFTAEGVTILKGRRYLVSDYIAGGITSTAPYLIVGDFRNFLVAQRAGMSVELVPHLFDPTTNRPTGERGLYAWARVGSDSINDKGFRGLANNA